MGMTGKDVEAMFLRKATTAIAIVNSTFCGIHEWRGSSIQAGPSDPALGPKQFAMNPPEMFPDGLEHDFGNVTRGTQCRHTFRIVSTTEVPLQIISLLSS